MKDLTNINLLSQSSGIRNVAFRRGEGISANQTIRDVFNSVSPQDKKDVEAWVVNTVKISMIKKMERVLENAGLMNVRKVFLVPLFTISDLTYRVNDLAPELRTMYFKELIQAVDSLKKRLS